MLINYITIFERYIQTSTFPWQAKIWAHLQCEMVLYVRFQGNSSKYNDIPVSSSFISGTYAFLLVDIMHKFRRAVTIWNKKLFYYVWLFHIMCFTLCVSFRGEGCIVHWFGNSQSITVIRHLYLVILGSLLFFY